MSKIVEIKSVTDINKPCIQGAETIIISNASQILDELGINKRHKYFSGKCGKDVEMVDNFLFSVDSIYNDAAGYFSEMFINCYKCLQNKMNVILPVSSNDNDSIFLAELFMAGKKIFDSCARNNQNENIFYPVVVGRNNNNEVIWAVDSLQDDNKLFCSLGSQYNYNEVKEKLYIKYGLTENLKSIKKAFKSIKVPPIIKDFLKIKKLPGKKLLNILISFLKNFNYYGNC